MDRVEVQLTLEAGDFAIKLFEPVIEGLVFRAEPFLRDFPGEVQVVELLNIVFVLALFGKKSLK